MIILATIIGQIVRACLVAMPVYLVAMLMHIEMTFWQAAILGYVADAMAVLVTQVLGGQSKRLAKN